MNPVLGADLEDLHQKTVLHMRTLWNPVLYFEDLSSASQLQHYGIEDQLEADPAVPPQTLLGRGFIRNLAVHFNSYPLPDPCLFLPLWGGVVRTLDEAIATAIRSCRSVALSGGGHCLCRRLHQRVQPSQQGHPQGPTELGNRNESVPLKQDRHLVIL